MSSRCHNRVLWSAFGKSPSVYSLKPSRVGHHAFSSSMHASKDGEVRRTGAPNRAALLRVGKRWPLLSLHDPSADNRMVDGHLCHSAMPSRKLGFCSSSLRHCGWASQRVLSRPSPTFFTFSSSSRSSLTNNVVV